MFNEGSQKSDAIETAADGKEGNIFCIKGGGGRDGRE